MFPIFEGRSNRSNVDGSIHLKLWLSSREDRGFSEEDDTMNAIEEHKKIYTVFIQHYLNEVRPRFLPAAAGQDMHFCLLVLWRPSGVIKFVFCFSFFG